MNNATKADLILFLYRKTGLSQVDIKETIVGFLSLIKEKLMEGHSIEIRGFGTFKTKIMAGHPVYNFKTKKKFYWPTRRSIVFKFSDDIKRNLKLLK